MNFDDLKDDSETTAPVPGPTPAPTPAPTNKPLMFDDIKPDVPKFDDLVDDSEKPPSTSTGDAGFAGLARGVTFGGSDVLASGLRKGASALGVPEQYLDYVAPSGQTLAKAEKEHPVATGLGEFAGSVGALRALPKIGSTAIDGMIKTGLVGAGNEVSKSMLGHGDPTPAVVGHIALSAGLGLLFGSAAGKVESYIADKAATDAENKIGSQILSKLAGVGHRAKGRAAATSSEEALQQLADTGVSSGLFDPKKFLEGQKFYDEVAFPRALQTVKYATAAPLAGKGALVGFNAAGPYGVFAGEELGRRFGLKAGDKIGKYIIPKAAENVIGPILLKMAQSGSFEGLAKAIDYGVTASKGYQAIDKGVNAIFQAGAGDVLNSVFSEAGENRREKLKKFIEDGGPKQLIDQQLERDETEAYAKGGEVLPSANNNPIEKHWPEQSMLLSAAKMRLTNHLNALRPQKKTGGLIYDRDIPDPHHERQYNKTLDLANNPLSILKHIKNGTLVPKQVKDLSAIYPELYDHLQKKITERIAHGQIKKEKKPNYKTRQALSLFLGSNLDSSMVPQNIMAAQAVFANQQAQQSAAKLNSLNKMGKNNQTAEQSRQQRLNKG